jgi:Raf kinase inhibitor-like YbhB/YbcL family protein
MSAVQVTFNLTFAGQHIGLGMVDPTTKKESPCPQLIPGPQLFGVEPGTEFRIYCGGLTYQTYLTTHAPVQNVQIVPSPDGGAKVVVPGLPMTLNSPAFQDFGPIPSKYTCDGANISPPLAWSGVPAKARSLVLIVEDEDATDDDGVPLSEPRVHWVLYNVPPNASLPEGEPLPAGTLEGVNGSGKTGYLGPCRPSGQDYYVHKLLALDRVIPDLGRASKRDLLAQIRRDQSRVIAQADLVGTYQKP